MPVFTFRNSAIQLLSNPLEYPFYPAIKIMEYRTNCPQIEGIPWFFLLVFIQLRKKSFYISKLLFYLRDYPVNFLMKFVSHSYNRFPSSSTVFFINAFASS